MKNLYILLATIFIYTTALSQSCLSEGIEFTTQEQIENFQTDYPGCMVIEGNVRISSGSNNLTNLNGLSVLTAIGGDLWIEINPFLGSLTGLDNLESVGGFVYLRYNEMLTDLTGLGNLESIGGQLDIFSMSSLTSLSGLTHLNTIGSYLMVFGCNSLTDLSGLENLTTIGGALTIKGNNILTSVGIEYLSEVGLNVSIENNDSLKNLNGLENLISAGGLFIEYNETLSDLMGLLNITTIGGGSLRVRYNPLLTDLTGLDHIDYESILHLYIYENPILPLCEVESICDYLTDPDPNPNRIVQIHDNAAGCNTEEEIVAACTVGISDINAKSYTFYPNPATNEIFISCDSGTIVNEINIYNQLGKNVLHQNRVDYSIDVSMLQSGVYIIELISGNSIIRTKLMIE